MHGQNHFKFIYKFILSLYGRIHNIQDKNVQNITQIVRTLLTSPGLEPREITSTVNEVDDATLQSLIHSMIFQNCHITVKHN